MNIPQTLFVVIDETGQPCHSATWPEACQGHINAAIEQCDIVEAKHWVVREYTLNQAKEPT